MLFRPIPKDPNAVLDFEFDWGTGKDRRVPPWLEDDETIATATVTVPAGLTKEDAEVSDDGKSVIVWLSGGTAGTSCGVVCHIVTTQSRTDERTMTIAVQER